MAELNILSTAELEQLEQEVGYLKLSDFTQLREKYESRNLTLYSLKHQLLAYSEKYQNELKKAKAEQDTEVLQQYTSLEKEINTLTSQLEKIEQKVMEMIDTPSPFAIANVKMPKIGTEDTYHHKKLEILPYTDDKTSVREVWNFLVEVGEDLKLSEKGFKRALWSRLNSEQRDSFDTYKEQPLKEAIQSLIRHYDNPMKTYHFLDFIQNFSRKPSENITNAIYRLLSYVDKAFRNPAKKGTEDKDLKVLRIRTLEDKLRGLCKSKDMFTNITKKLDRIKEQNKNPTIQDIIQAAQIEEESYERGEMSKVALHLNHMDTCDLNNLDVEEKNQYEGFVEEDQYQEFPNIQDGQEFDEDQDHILWAKRSGWKQNQGRRNDQRRNMGHQDYQTSGMGYQRRNDAYYQSPGMGYQGRYDGYYQDQTSGMGYQRRNDGYQYPQKQYERRNYGPPQYHGGGQEDYQHQRQQYGNGRRYNDKPWIPPVIAQRVTVQEETNEIDTTLQEGEEDNEEPLVE